jgi:hypothetical protein
LPPARPNRATGVLALDPPAASGIDARGLVALADDAARRAWELAASDGDGGLGLTRDEDLARRAAGMLGTPGLAHLAHLADMPARTLTSWAVAWREGGAAGLAVAREPVRVDAGAMDEARLAFADLFGEVPVVVRANRATAGRSQLRLGADGQWYLFSKQFNDWMLTRPPAPDPAALLEPGRTP